MVMEKGREGEEISPTQPTKLKLKRKFFSTEGHTKTYYF